MSAPPDDAESAPSPPTNPAARLRVQRDGLLALLDDARAELAQARVELDRERAVSVGLLPRTYTIEGKTRADVHHAALVAAGVDAGGTLPDLRARFDALIKEWNAALVAHSRERN